MFKFIEVKMEDKNEKITSYKKFKNAFPVIASNCGCTFGVDFKIIIIKQLQKNLL